MGDLDNLRHKLNISARWLTVTSVQDWAQRRVLIKDIVSTTDADDLVLELETLFSSPFASPSHTIVALSLASAVIHGMLSPPVLVKLNASASKKNCLELAAIFTSMALHRVPQEQLKIESSKPLGFRKSLARTSDRNLLTRVRADPHPSVLDIYLGNPNVTERDVVAVAAKRPNYAQSLLSIASHATWVSRYKVRSALFFNPKLPTFAATALGLSIRSQDLRTTKELGLSAERIALAEAISKLRID